jgi:poly-gamma-glutamate synthesis protein (capsule biosynthesis protein)
VKFNGQVQMRGFLLITSLILALTSPTNAAHSSDTPNISNPSNSSNSVNNVTLSFGGDVNGEYPISKTLSRGANPLGDASSIFKKSDIAAVNLETVVSTLGTPVEKQFTFAAPYALLSALKKGGVSVVNVANNHSFDFGTQAFLDTMQNIQEAKLISIGGGANYTSAWAPRIFTIRGIKVAFIGVGNVNGGKISVATYKTPGVTSNWDQKGVLAAIAAAKAITPIVIVMVHWGVEKTHCARNVEKRSAALWFKAGATAIIGSHPHFQQAIVTENGSTVAYSLGNLTFYVSRGDAGRTGVLTLQITSAGKVATSTFTPMRIDPLTGAPKLVSPSAATKELDAITSYGLATCVDPTPVATPAPTPAATSPLASPTSKPSN